MISSFTRVTCIWRMTQKLFSKKENETKLIFTHLPECNFSCKSKLLSHELNEKDSLICWMGPDIINDYPVQSYLDNRNYIRDKNSNKLIKHNNYIFIYFIRILGLHRYVFKITTIGNVHKITTITYTTILINSVYQKKSNCNKTLLE